jgi:hypothetical protein
MHGHTIDRNSSSSIKFKSFFLSPEQFSKIIETLDADGPGQQIALAWIAKEKPTAGSRVTSKSHLNQG